MGLVACGETMKSGVDDESSRLQTTADGTLISSGETADSMRASLTEEKINVFVACIVTEDETAMDCKPQQDEPSSLQFKFEYKAFDFEGKVMKSTAEFKEALGITTVTIGDISELSHIEVSTSNKQVTIENPRIEFY